MRIMRCLPLRWHECTPWRRGSSIYHRSATCIPVMRLRLLSAIQTGERLWLRTWQTQTTTAARPSHALPGPKLRIMHLKMYMYMYMRNYKDMRMYIYKM